MMKHRLFRTALPLLALVSGASNAGAQGRQVLSAVNADPAGSGADRTELSGIAGQGVSLAAGGSDARALTDFGVNKIAASSDGSYKMYATSAWLDTYTATGAAGSTVRVTFDFTMDGSASFGAGATTDYNFNVVALRGDNWSLHGQGGTTVNGWVPQRSFGDGYESPLLSRPSADGTTITTYLPRLADKGATLWNYQNDNGEPGDFVSRVRQAGSNYIYETQSAATPWIRTSDVFTPTYMRRDQTDMNTGVVTRGQMIFYSSRPDLLQVYNNFRANYALLGVASICAATDEDTGLCLPATYPPTVVSLAFDVTAGSTFSIAALLYADDVEGGTSIDFYNTAKLSGITALGGGLTSANAQFRQNADGTFGYAPAAANGAVPEPATWAMMILGFGAIGGAMRRRRQPRQASAAASIAVAAPASA